MSTDHTAIAVRVRELAQLFNSLDPSPFHDQDLAGEADQYTPIR